MKPFVRSPYNYDTRAASQQAVFEDRGEQMTDQSGKDDADINVLVARFGVIPIIEDVPMPPSDSDFSSEVFDYMDSMNLIRRAQESFDAMSASTRERFYNDPAKFVNFCSELSEDGKSLANISEMRKMGLAVPEEPAIVEPPPQKVLIVNPPEVVDKPK